MDATEQRAWHQQVLGFNQKKADDPLIVLCQRLIEINPRDYFSYKYLLMALARKHAWAEIWEIFAQLGQIVWEVLPSVADIMVEAAVNEHKILLLEVSYTIAVSDPNVAQSAAFKRAQSMYLAKLKEMAGDISREITPTTAKIDYQYQLMHGHLSHPDKDITAATNGNLASSEGQDPSGQPLAPVQLVLAGTLEQQGKWFELFNGLPATAYTSFVKKYLVKNDIAPFIRAEMLRTLAALQVQQPVDYVLLSGEIISVVPSDLIMDVENSTLYQTVATQIKNHFTEQKQPEQIGPNLQMLQASLALLYPQLDHYANLTQADLIAAVGALFVPNSALSVPQRQLMNQIQTAIVWLL